jgi:glycosyltransferase involved in cell wall biosynthesis
MRILITTIDLPENLDMIRGGVHAALRNLLTGFANTDATIRVLSFHQRNQPTKTVRFANNIELVYIREGWFSFHLLNFLFLGSRILRNQIRSFNPDLVHFQEGNAFLFTRMFGLLGRPLVLTIHGMAHDEARRKKRWKDRLTWHINGMIHDWLLPKHLIHLSQFSYNRNSHSKNGKEIIIPNAINPLFFELPLKQQFERKILYVGQIDPNKNIRFTLRILHALNQRGKKYSLDVLGGFSLPEFETLVRQDVQVFGLEDQVCFHGWVGQTEIMRALEESDILMVSSLHESLPMVIAEARAAGKLVLASRVGGIPEMMRDQEDGYLFDHANEIDLIETLDELHDDAKRVLTMGVLAREHAKKTLHSKEIALQTLSFYRTILHPTSP